MSETMWFNTIGAASSIGGSRPSGCEAMPEQELQFSY